VTWRKIIVRNLAHR